MIFEILNMKSELLFLKQIIDITLQQQFRRPPMQKLIHLMLHKVIELTNIIIHIRSPIHKSTTKTPYLKLNFVFFPLPIDR